MNQSLVYRQQIAARASANADLRDDAGLFALTIITAGGKSAADAEKAALAELDKLKTGPVTAAELDKARNMLLSDALRARETAGGQASALGEAAVGDEHVGRDRGVRRVHMAGGAQRLVTVERARGLRVGVPFGEAYYVCSSAEFVRLASRRSSSRSIRRRASSFSLPAR